MGFFFLHIYLVAKGIGNDDTGKNFLYVPFVASSNDDSISSTFDSHVSCACNSLVLQWSLLVRCFRLRKAASTSLYPKNLVSRTSPQCFCSPEVVGVKWSWVSWFTFLSKTCIRQLSAGVAAITAQHVMASPMANFIPDTRHPRPRNSSQMPVECQTQFARLMGM
jgi:hypothetical protein